MGSAPGRTTIAEFLRSRWPLLIALWVAVSSNAAIIAVLWPKAEAVDFAVFWRAVHALHPYAPNEQPFVYPPTSLLWFWPLRLAEVWPAYVAWTAVSVILFGAAALLLYGRGATIVALISPAAAVALIPGQTSLIASALLFLAFATESRIARGALLGLLLTFKPQLGMLAPLFLLVHRDWTAILIMLMTGIGMSLATTAAFGANIWWDWLAALPQFQQIVATRGLSMSAVSPAAFATMLHLPRLPLLVLGWAIGIGIALSSRRLDRGEQPAMIATASLFAAPYALRYDMMAIAPAMAAIILTDRNRKALLACVAYSATFGPLSLAAAAVATFWQRSEMKQA